MKRRVLLLVGSFALVLMTFLVYRAFEEVGEDRQLPSEPDTLEEVSEPGQEASPLDAPAGTDLEIVDRDDEGSLRGLYTAARWEKLPDDNIRLEKPKVIFHHPGGQQTTITAEHGLAQPLEAGGRMTIRSGRLSGDVQIYFDQSTEPDPPPMDQRLHEVVRIYTDSIEFDNERLEINTEDRVELYSAEADIFGTGLTIAWNEGLGEGQQRELRLLRIEQGEYLAVYTGARQITGLSTAVEDTTDEPPEAEPAVPDLEKLTALPEDLWPTTMPVVDIDPAAMPPEAPPTELAEAEFVPPKMDIQDAPEGEPRNIYQAVFHGSDAGSVRVRSPEGQVNGADTIAITFQWEGQFNGTDDFRSPGEPDVSTPAEPTPGESPEIDEEEEPDETEAEPLEVFWSGPLVIQPQGHTPTPSSDRYIIEADGERVSLVSDGNIATCRRMVYDHDGDAGVAWLLGVDETPARLDLDDGAIIACRRIRFDDARGVAHLTGPGRLLQPADSAGQALADEGEEDRPEDIPEAQPAETDYDAITFGGEVIAAFDRDGERRRGLREAIFTGGVELTQADTDDFITSDELHVRTARVNGGSLYVERAVASGSVRAIQGDDEIEADRASLWLSSQREPVRLLAEGNVTVLGSSAEDEEEPGTASADRLEVWPEDERAELTGNASIIRGRDSLSGEAIYLDDRERTLMVPGAGVLEFEFDRDLSGAELDESRPVRISWRDSMNYGPGADDEGLAEFRGGVELISDMDRLECGEMDIFFSPTPDEPAEATDEPLAEGETGEGEPHEADSAQAEAAEVETVAEAPPAEPDRTSTGRVGLGMESYSDRSIRLIRARDDVLLFSSRTDPDEALTQRLQLRGARLSLDVPDGEFDVYEAGTLLVEDYRPPRDDDGAGDEGVERPFQTLFAWDESMKLAQEERLVVMTGNVRMVHLSGRALGERDDLLEGIPHPEWSIEQLPSGRHATLTCEQMVARFGEPSEDPSAGAVAADDVAGPRVGPLDMFTATEQVNLRINEAHIQGERLLYHRENDLAVVWGYREGRPVANAQIDYEDPQTGRRSTVRSSRFTAFIRDGEVYRVETGPAEAVGGQ